MNLGEILYMPRIGYHHRRKIFSFKLQRTLIANCRRKCYIYNINNTQCVSIRLHLLRIFMITCI